MPNSERAFVDTTVYTDALLKIEERGAVARRALGNYAETVLPVYAIKEFRAGPLNNLVWAHNTIHSNSLSDAVGKIGKMAATLGKRKALVALEGLNRAIAETQRDIPSNEALVREYGPAANPIECLRDRLRLQLRRVIETAWRKRRAIVGKVIDVLPCFEETEAIEDESGLLEFRRLACTKGAVCAVGRMMTKKKDKLKKLRAVLKGSEKLEHKRCRKALKGILFEREDEFHKHCRGLGDAVFVISCPDGAIILTTNQEDFELLSSPFGTQVQRPT